MMATLSSRVLSGARFVSAIVVVVQAATAGSPYELLEAYVGPDFFQKFDFWSQPDPTHGSVKYIDRVTARTEGLVWAESGRAYMGVDMVQSHSSHSSEGFERHSVRIQSKAVYNSGLFIIDVEHMPTGCGTWPAFWMFGQDSEHVWPTWGEFDMIEVVHNRSSIMTTLHTGPGCNQTSLEEGVHFSQTWEKASSGVKASNCDVSAKGQDANMGCSQKGREASAGSAFNSKGGGTFASEWDPEAGHIRSWFWPQGSVPLDVRSRVPQPQLWGVPDSYFSLSKEVCAGTHFQNMRLVLNIALCGDLGNPMLASMCPLEAKTMTCEQLIADPKRMSQAYWMIRSLDVYSRSDAVAFAFLMDHPESGNPVLSFLSSRSAELLLVGALVLALCYRAELVKWTRLRRNLPSVGEDMESARASEVPVPARRFSLASMRQALLPYLPGAAAAQPDNPQPQPRARRKSSVNSLASAASEFMGDRFSRGGVEMEVQPDVIRAKSVTSIASELMGISASVRSRADSVASRKRADTATSVTAILGDWSRPELDIAKL